jgi:hypothetical protein
MYKQLRSKLAKFKACDAAKKARRSKAKRELIGPDLILSNPIRAFLFFSIPPFGHPFTTSISHLSGKF